MTQTGESPFSSRLLPCRGRPVANGTAIPSAALPIGKLRGSKGAAARYLRNEAGPGRMYRSTRRTPRFGARLLNRHGTEVCTSTRKRSGFILNLHGPGFESTRPVFEAHFFFGERAADVSSSNARPARLFRPRDVNTDLYEAT